MKGSSWGMTIRYAVQRSPDGWAGSTTASWSGWRCP